jgi:hypothetical protein
LLSAIVVFIASSIIHMALPLHKSDYRKLPDEEKLLDAMRVAGVTPGRVYHFPFTSMKEMKLPETAEKFKRGPVGLLTVRPSGMPVMAKFLGQWFLYCVVVSVFAAYVTGIARTPGAPYIEVFRVAATVALAGYTLALVQNSIWKGEVWGVTFKHLVDGLIYSLLTGAVFGWLWPK